MVSFLLNIFTVLFDFLANGILGYIGTHVTILTTLVIAPLNLISSFFMLMPLSMSAIVGMLVASLGLTIFWATFSFSFKIVTMFLPNSPIRTSEHY